MEEMKFGNYTCETQHGAHTFNANSSTTGKTLKFENVCVMIRIQLHTKLPPTSDILKAILIIKPRVTSRGIPTTYHN